MAQIICLQCNRPGFNPRYRKIPWKRERLPTPLYLPGEFHGQKSLAGCIPRDCKELDMNEQLTQSQRDWRSSKITQCLWHTGRWVYVGTSSFFFFPFIFISWRLITLQYCSGFCHTLTWISHGVTGIPHPDPPSHLPLYPIPLGFPSAPGPSTCLMHPYVGTSMAGGSVKQGLRDANIWTS